MSKSPKPLYDSIIQEMQYDKINFEPTLYSNPYSNESAVKLPGFEVGDYGRKVQDVDPLSKGIQGLQEERAQNQSNWEKIGNDFGKMGLTALATFLDGTVGTLAGAINVMAKGEANAFWNNPISNKLQDMLEWSEEALPNYSTQEQANMPWYESMIPFSGNATNFWGDMVLKNMGFMIGTVASSALYGGLARNVGKSLLGLKDTARNVGKGLVGSFTKGEVSGGKVLSEAIVEGKKLQDINFASQIIGSIAGSAGEARIEAIQSVRDYVKQAKEANPGISEEQLMEEATNIGNAVFGMNMAILSIGNYAQFKDAIGGGYKLNKIAKNGLVKGELGNLTSAVESKAGKALYVGKTIGKSLGNSAWEGSEEQLQKVAQESAKKFYGLGKDDETENEFKTLADTFVSTLGDQFGSIDNWQDFAVGFISGGIGSPNVTNMRNKVWAGGMWDELSELRGINKKAKDLAKAGNEAQKRVETLYNSSLKNIYLEKQKKNALDLGDRFEWENANHAQIVNDINTMLELGRYEEYLSALKSKANFKPEEIKLAVEQEGTENRYINDTDEEVKQEVQKRIQDIEKVAEFVKKERDNLKVKFPGIDNKVLGELAYYVATEQNSTERSDAIVKKLNELTQLQDGRTAQELAQFKAKRGNLLNALRESKDKINQAKNRLNEILNKDYSNSPELKQVIDELNGRKQKLEEQQLESEIQLEETLKRTPKGSRKEIARQTAIINNKIAELHSKIEQLKFEQEQISGENLDKKIQEAKKAENQKLSKEYSDNLDVLENTKAELLKIDEEERFNRSKIKEEASKEGLTDEEYIDKINELVTKNEEFNKRLDNLYEYKPNLKSDVQPLLDDLVKIEKRKSEFIKNLAKAYESNGIKTLSEELKKFDDDRQTKKNKKEFDKQFKDNDIIYDKTQATEYQVKDDGKKKHLYKKDTNGKWTEYAREFKYEDGALERYSLATEKTDTPTQQTNTNVIINEKGETIVTTTNDLFPVEIKENEVTLTIEEEVDPTEWYDTNPKPLAADVQNKTTGNIGEVPPNEKRRKLILKADRGDLDLEETIRFQNFLEDNVFHTGEFKGKLISGAKLFGEAWEKRATILKSKGFNPNKAIYMIIVDKNGNEQKDKDGNLIFTTLSTQSAYTPVLVDGKPKSSATLTKADFTETMRDGRKVPKLLLVKDKDGNFTSEQFDGYWKNHKAGIKKNYKNEFTDDVQVLKAKFAINKEGWKEDSDKSEEEYIKFIASPPEFVTITHKTLGISLLTEEPYDVTDYIKDKGLKPDEFDIEVAQKNSIAAFGKEFEVRKGFTYLLDNKNGKIIQLTPRVLTNEEKQLVIDLLTTYCSNLRVKDGKVEPVSFEVANKLQIINKDGTTDASSLSITELLSLLIGFGGINNVSNKTTSRQITKLHKEVREARSAYQNETNPTKKSAKLKDYNDKVAALNKINNTLAVSKRSIFFQTEVHNLPTKPGGYIMIGLDKDNNPIYKPLLEITEGKAKINPEVTELLNKYLQDKWINVKATVKSSTIAIPTKITDGKVNTGNIIAYNKEVGGYKAFLTGSKPSKGEKIKTPLTTRVAKVSKDFKTTYHDGTDYEGRVPTAANVYLGIDVKQQAKPVETKKTTTKQTDKMAIPDKKVKANSDFNVEETTENKPLTGKLDPNKLANLKLGDRKIGTESKKESPVVEELTDEFAGLTTTSDENNDFMSLTNITVTVEQKINEYLSSPEKIFDENESYFKKNQINKEGFLEVFDSLSDTDKIEQIKNILENC